MASSSPKTCADWAKLTSEDMQTQMSSVPSWKLVEEDGINKLELIFRSKDFDSSLAYLMSVGSIANRIDHRKCVH